MASLATAMTAGDGVAVLSAAVNFASLPAPITIDSENLLVTSGDNLATISVSRGQNGTAAASHAIGTTVTLGWGGGGGFLTVDNTVDPPAEVTTIVAPGATFDGAEVTLVQIPEWVITEEGAELEIVSELNTTRIRLRPDLSSIFIEVALTADIDTNPTSLTLGSDGSFEIGNNNAAISADSAGAILIIGASGGIEIAANGNTTLPSVLLTSLPTVNPAVAGQLWADSGVVKVSAG